jgi:putative membrane protein insertion efficiency factor
MKRFLSSTIRFYQRKISPLLGDRCKFYPTCSEYALQAIEKYGAFKGSLKAVWRILRCNHMSRGGYDPVK